MLRISHFKYSTSRYGDTFHFISHKWGESTGDQWIPLAKDQ